jgi:hypothetical protein
MTTATQIGSLKRKLYQDGKRYLEELRTPKQGKYVQDELKPIAEAYQTSVAEVRTAVDFVLAVNWLWGWSAVSSRTSSSSIWVPPVSRRLRPKVSSCCGRS